MIDKELKKSLLVKSQALKPVVILGNNGLTDNVTHEINLALDTHELIKIRINASDREERDILIEAICKTSNAELIQKIGHVISIYRARPKKK